MWEEQAQNDTHTSFLTNMLVVGWFVAMVCIVQYSANAQYTPSSLTWTSPTQNSVNKAGQPVYSGGMPLGNGVTAAYAWVDVDAGSIDMYVRRSDALALDSSLFTLAHVSVAFSPNPFTSTTFNQTMDPATATMIVTTPSITASVWVEYDSDAIHVKTSSPSPLSANVAVQSVRPSTISSYYNRLCWEGVTAPDIIPSTIPAPLPSTSLLIYHRNDESTDSEVFEKTLMQQNLTEAIGMVENPLRNLTFGLSAFPSSSSPSFTRSSPTTLNSTTTSTTFELLFTTAAAQTASLTDFFNLLASVEPSPSKPSHDAAWSVFWNRSYIKTNISAITDAYDNTRYLQAIQSRGKYPIKFNGGLFIATQEVEGNQTKGGPDYRDWGCANWWQNERLPYWGMLSSGDVDLMSNAHFEYYLRMLPLLEHRTEKLMGHVGAFVTETKMVFGLYSSEDYGCTRPAGYPSWLETNPYIHLDFGGNAGLPEIGLMVLDAYDVTQNATLLSRYLPLLNSTLSFFLHHYPTRDATGKMVVFPTQSLETYWCPDWPPGAECVTNDMPTVALVTQLTRRALALPTSLTTPAQRQAWNALSSLLPPLPTSSMRLLPAEKYVDKRHNSETPDLYATHPARIYSVGGAIANASINLTLARNSFAADPNAHTNGGWNQGIMNAALLGMADTAAQMVLQRAETGPAKGYRWPWFGPHEQDYEPSSDHYANLVSSLQWMALQNANDQEANVILLPAWPCAWDADIKLVASKATTVSFSVRNGTLSNLQVQPPQRTQQVKVLPCQ